MENLQATQNITSDVTTKVKPEFVSLVAVKMPHYGWNADCHDAVVLAEAPSGTTIHVGDYVETPAGKAEVVNVLQYVNTSNDTYDFINTLVAQQENLRVTGVWSMREARWNE